MSNQEGEAPLREHSFDGIREYDKKLPNWWLWTLYGAIFFSVFYWSWAHLSGLKPTPEQALQAKLMDLNTNDTEGASREFSDDELWKMSRNDHIVAEGKKVFVSTCASCHGLDMKGGIGLNLIDNEWKNGQKPTELIQIVTHGVLKNGMPAWGPVLGERRITEVVSYVLSKHTPPSPE